ncbi:MAG TPA: NADH:ubiquinone reductase (Na(+)-transporting) subunit D [Saprospiraceae bacterium]|nr:NADH:ubiquinone reductase (Na(+)-transporting) subunit D [Saprospiraceae bacterium]
MAEVKELEKKSSGIEFGKAERKLLTDPLNDNNPITVQVLGVCSALAVTTLMSKALVMAIAVTFVTMLANYFTSVLRNYIPKQVRMIVQLVIIAFLVTIVELALKALNFAMYKDLSVFIGLIITNCIVMGRLEAFALNNTPYRSLLDGLGNGLGYGWVLIVVAFFRELLGKGTIFDFKIIGNTPEFLINTTESTIFGWYANTNLMVLFPSAMFVIGAVIYFHRAWNAKLVDVS